MIPKIIHYCWFGGGPLPEKDRRCIESWKKMCPDYTIMQWDETNYDISKNRYMKEAYDAKKWGFVPDFARLDIVYEHGGVYLDTDVELIRNLDDLLHNKAVMGFEDGKMVNPGSCVAAEKNHPALKQLMEMYNHLTFLQEDGSYNLTPSPVMNTDFLLKYGLKQDNTKQIVADITIYPTEYFCPKDFFTGKLTLTNSTYSIHWFNASWQAPKQKFLLKVRRIVGPNIFFKLVAVRNFLFKRPKEKT